MIEFLESRKNSLVILGAIVTLALLILWRAPEEQTLGSGIKSVYVHVALSWTGLAGFSLAGLLGLATAVSGREEIESWARPIGWVALAAFAAGLVMSVLAARVNWGGMFWQEPRTNAALQILAVGLIVQLATAWPLPARLKGTLRLGLVLFAFWLTGSTPLVLHPRNPARASSSMAIRLTFFSLFVLFSLAAAWFVLQLRQRQLQRAVQES